MAPIHLLGPLQLSTRGGEIGIFGTASSLSANRTFHVGGENSPCGVFRPWVGGDLHLKADPAPALKDLEI